MSFNKRSLALLVAVCFSFLSVSNYSHAEENIGVTPSTITFGASFPLTGAASPGISSYYFGINAYFDYVNANGGIYGRKLVFLNLDNSGSPSLAVGKTNELILSFSAFSLISNCKIVHNQANYF